MGIAATADQFTYDGPLRDPIDAGPIKLDAITFNGVINGLPSKWPKNLEAAMRSWANNKGTVNIRQLDISKKPVLAKTKGEISSDPKGLLHGTVRATVFNLNHVIDQLANLGRLSENDAKVSKGLFKILSGDKPDGEIVTDLRLKKGKVYFGPFKLLKLKPIF